MTGTDLAFVIFAVVFLIGLGTAGIIYRKKEVE